NQRFGKPPADRQAVWRRPPRDLALRLGCGYRRVVARDNTVRLGPRVVQLRGARSYARLTVDVRELLDGRVVVLHDEVIRGEAPSPGPTFILKPRRAPSGDRRPRRVGRACHGWPPTRTLAVDRSPPIPGGARRRPRFGCMKHEPGGRFHVAATEDLITEQRQTARSGVRCDRESATTS